jgi:hypothetical protein
MATFEALGELLDETLTLPVAGRTYTIPAPSAEVGLRTQAIIQAAAKAAQGGEADAELLDDVGERDLFAEVLGEVYERMIADGVSWPALKHCALTAMIWIASGVEQAEAYWRTGGDPSRAAPPNRAARRALARSGGANATKSQGSMSGTSTRPAATPATHAPPAG